MGVTLDRYHIPWRVSSRPDCHTSHLHLWEPLRGIRQVLSQVERIESPNTVPAEKGKTTAESAPRICHTGNSARALTD